MRAKTKVKYIFLLGILVILMPYIGVPRFWKNITLVLIGICISWLSLFLYHFISEQNGERRKSDAFAESRMSDINPPKNSEHV
jgi:hypothetical protein